jgi:hypothetical protein
MNPTADRVRNLFEYNPLTGVLKRKTTAANNARAGCVVGWENSDGYLNVKVDRRIYKVHQIVWLHCHGVWPSGVIDHINRNKKDNRLQNLRDTTVQVNNINKGARKDNKTGVPNVTWRERDKRYYVACKRDGRQNYGGSFKTLVEAKIFAERFVSEIGRNME